MQVEQVVARFKDLSQKGLVCHLNGRETVADISKVGRDLNVEFPDDVVQFWGTINGLEIPDPQLTLLPISRMHFDDRLLVFGKCNGNVRLAFDMRTKNEAGQFSLVNADTGYLITYTMASFWSIHLWTWIVKRRPIWFNAHAPRFEPD